MRYLVVRIGAFGDVVITTPLIRELKKRDNEVYVLTSERGEQILRYNPNIDKLIVHKKNSIPNDKLGEYFEEVSKENKCDKVIDLCSSIETELCLYPIQPEYNWSKQERSDLCNKNYYEHMFYKAGLDITEDTDLKPEVFFSEKEKEDAAIFKSNYIGKKLIIVGLSGSGLNKAYPHFQYVMSAVLEGNKDVMFITTGDESCKVLEAGLVHERVLHRSGVWSFRQSMAACQFGDAVIAPDTGILHASGCFDTPKIGLFGATTKENVTKHFANDYSLEASCSCAPCFRLIYRVNEQCPVETDSGATFCMGLGLDPNIIVGRIMNIVGVKK